MKIDRNTQGLRSALAIALMLWCAGAGCMIVSYAHGVAMSATEGAQTSSSNDAWAGVTGSAGAHAGCKARHASERQVARSMTNHASSSGSLAEIEGLAEVLSSSDAMSCCPLTTGTILAAGRQLTSNEEASASQGLDPIAVVNNVTSTPLAIPLRLPNQNQTYLRGCVFLI